MYPDESWGLYSINLLMKILLSLFRRSADMLIGSWSILLREQFQVKYLELGLKLLSYFCLGDLCKRIKIYPKSEDSLVWESQKIFLGLYKQEGRLWQFFIFYDNVRAWNNNGVWNCSSWKCMKLSAEWKGNAAGEIRDIKIIFLLQSSFLSLNGMQG